METFVKKLEIFFSTRKTPCFSPYSIAKAFFLLALASNDAIFFKIADAFGCGGKSREEATECMKNAVWVKHFAAGAESFFREANVVFSCLDFDDKYLKMLHENLCLGESNIIASKEIFSGVVINRKCSDATHNKIPKICENSSCYNAFILNVLFAEFTWCRPLAPDFQLVFRGMFGDDKQLLTMKSTSSIVKIDPLSGDIYVTMQTREGPVFSLFLPAAGSSSENLFERLDFNKKDLVPHPNSSNIEVILPVFSLNPDILSLADLCAHLGIADLLGVEGVVPGLGALAKIDEMSQAAMMGISLNGFIGAATTLVGYSAKGGQPSLIPPYRIEFNRPFAYQLQHNGSVYFAGFITQGSQLIASAPAREY